jgi:hypothetical protein
MDFYPGTGFEGFDISFGDAEVVQTKFEQAAQIIMITFQFSWVLVTHKSGCLTGDNQKSFETIMIHLSDTTE